MSNSQKKLKKNNAGTFAFPNTKTYCKIMVMKALQYYYRNMWCNGTGAESGEMVVCVCV